MVVGSIGRSFFASCVSGMEPVLAAELRSARVGGVDVEEGRLGVAFVGPPAVGTRAVLWSRTALRVMELLNIGEGVTSPEALYDFARAAAPWRDLLADRRHTISVQSVLSAGRALESGRARPGDWHCGACGSLVFASRDACFKCGAPRPVEPSSLTHTHFSSLTVKNAVCDSLREAVGWRPSVDTEGADLPLLLHVHRGRASLYRLLSGASSMHKRGYRAGGPVHVAALRETLAAGALLKAGYEPEEDVLCDPMAGSGTIAIEAALLATNTAPGLLRSAPPLVHWPDWPMEAWTEAVEEAHALDQRGGGGGAPRPILANDWHGGALDLARRAARAAGVEECITFSEVAAASYQPEPPPSLVLTNPPWGERLDEGAEEAWHELRTFLKGRCAGSRAWVFSGNRELTRHLRMRAAQKLHIESSGSSLALIAYDVLGKRKGKRGEGEGGDAQSKQAQPAAEVTAEAAADEGSAEEELSDLSGLTVTKLKDLLRARGLPVSGKKAALIERLESGGGHGGGHGDGITVAGSASGISSGDDLEDLFKGLYSSS